MNDTCFLPLGSNVSCLHVVYTGSLLAAGLHFRSSLSILHPPWPSCTAFSCLIEPAAHSIVRVYSRHKTELLKATVKVTGLICASICAWYLGYLFAELLPEDSIQTAIDSVQQVGVRPVLKAPVPKKMKCGVWTQCGPDELPYLTRSGGAKDVMPLACLDDEFFLGGSNQKGDRGINIVVINHETWKAIDIKTFDMYDGDFSGPMVEFINKIPQGSVIMISSHDDAFSKLSEDAKKVFEGLGSKEVRNLKFRSAWVFLSVKGATLPEYLEKEKVTIKETPSSYCEKGR
uniref:FAM3 metabolism regulating signaling molecule B n=1 Tax=Leptobrachium leishanense TaxID=445787 RepID=A0A8C5LZC2_9ANUR